MTTYAELHAVVPSRFLEAAVVMRGFAESVAAEADAMTAAIALLESGWTGTAATAAIAHLTELRSELYDAYPGQVDIDQALSEFATTLDDARRAAIAAGEPRPGSLVQVSPDGVASFRPGAVPAPADHAELASITAAVADAIRLANSADAEAARRLGTVPQAADGPAPSAVPTRGTEPGTVAAWWRAQSAAVQQRLIDDRTDAIANLDGIPADARDQAARLLLHREAAQLALDGTPASERELAGLATVEDRLDAPDARRAYLLGLDASDDRVIVAVGDPGRATDTLTFVPGIGSGLTNVGQTLDAIDNIQVAAEQLPPSDRRSSEADLSTIAWLDYATPATIEQAAKTAPATAGATRLSTFTAGLRTDSTQPGAHETVLGYSYGSVVTGVAAAQHGLDTDDVVLVGSPGTTVDTAAELGVDPDHVWATVARHDPIRLAGTWFGRSPVDPAFGARVFTSAPGSIDAPVATHMGYFETGTPSLENIARIAVGQTSEVF